MSKLRRLALVGILVAGGVVGAGQQAFAALYISFGDVLCHAESAGPHYFHSEIDAPGYSSSEFMSEWWPRDQRTLRRLERRTLQYLAAGFARYVTENYSVGYLLSPRCELREVDSGTAELENAAYTASDGTLVPYEDNQKTAVNWLPNFGGVFRHNGMALSDRVALVIGNAEYEHVRPLRSPANDAEEVGAALGRLGFDTTILVDADAPTMHDALRAFELRAGNADIALVFYSGHGVEAGGVNYLIPVSASVETSADLLVQAVALDRIVMAVRYASVPIVILDSARVSRWAADNPLAAEDPVQGARSVEESAGLARDPEQGVLLVFCNDLRASVVRKSGTWGIHRGVALAHRRAGTGTRSDVPPRGRHGFRERATTSGGLFHVDRVPSDTAGGRGAATGAWWTGAGAGCAGWKIGPASGVRRSQLLASKRARDEIRSFALGA